MRVRSCGSVVLALALYAGGTRPVAGQGYIDIRGGGPVVRLRTAVTAHVTGRVARVEVEEWFQNRGGLLAEGDYQYPLPGESSFADLSLWQGDQELKGETMDAARARAIYEEIVRRRRDPALVELVGHGLIRARIFPIGPGETRRVTIRYTQLLARAGDALVFRYAAGTALGNGWVVPVPPRPRPPWPLPMPPTPMPQPRPDEVPPVLMPNAPPPTPPQAARPGEAPHAPPQSATLGSIDFTLVVDDGAAFRDPFSPTHELRSERRDGRLTVRPSGPLSGDFAVFLPLARGLAGVTVATHRVGGEDGYVMITLSPGEGRGTAVARDVSLVLDVSGSMSGEKIEQARRAAKALLEALSQQDRFRLIAFNSSIDPYRTAWTSATAAELSAARRWVDGLQASGSTDIGGALAEAFRAETPAGRLGIVVFLTDGLPTVGEQNPDRIAERAEHDRGAARVFAFGIGYDVNVRLLDQLTAAARGTTAFVEPGEDLERPIAQLATRIRYPVLTDLRLAGAPVELRDLYPSPLPDLFAGDELVLFGRYRGAGTGDVAFTGVRGGTSERFSVGVAFPEEARGDDYIPRLWAGRRIGVLTRELRLHGRNQEVIDEVRDLGLRYGILTEYTSYLVQEPNVAAAPVLMRDMAAVGYGAVKSAEAARQRREVTTVAGLARADAELAPAAAPTPAGVAAKVVAGRRFTKQGDTWSDGLRKDGARVVTIEPFSPAYFAALHALPELGSWWSALAQVEVSGRAVALRVAPGGVRSLTPAEIERLVADFRRS